ncbi:PQQ-dependent sugar dehydrogenase [Sulfuriflexus sp.]|uniref:PQQ-dependent sugar dehydrogenase n=1 Tax=Sulfuriflexus sp. TaxID=2015443 RepID=UPI0028CE8EA4|nr:PQQ-dependent sugar dehydrogenase [Sulfuriflexus sp.]MDT8404938.1 PQQ-dependent sugar dehydrogenase [Sulfuriflexus sp.]
MNKIILFVLFMLVPGLVTASKPLAYQQQRVTLNGKTVDVRLPQGYRLELVTAALDAPRLISFAANGDLFIGSRSGHVYRLPPPYSESEVLIELDNYPHSVAFRRGEILIAQTDGVYRAAYKPGQKRLAPADLRLLAPLPAGGGHNSRTVRTGPDGRVYVSLGITGNCSDQYMGEGYDFDDRRGGVLVLDESGQQPAWQTFASGLRNPVGFDWHPDSGVMYASNNGPDHWGFTSPPEYFARLLPGSFHGMPWFQYDGEQLQRDECISSQPPRPATEVSLPVVTFPARNAPMAVSFVPKDRFINALEQDAIVALRGSWGTSPGGGAFGDPATRRPPKIVAVRFKNGEVQRVDDLLTGFQRKDGSRWARPVGVATGPDGALYFTSDSGMHGLFRLQKMR